MPPRGPLLGREYSLESAETRAGYFTLAGTEALKVQADFNRDSYVYLGEIERYAAQRVARLSDGAQHPMMTRPPSIRSFPLARQGP